MRLKYFMSKAIDLGGHLVAGGLAIEGISNIYQGLTVNPQSFGASSFYYVAALELLLSSYIEGRKHCCRKNTKVLATMLRKQQENHPDPELKSLEEELQNRYITPLN